MKRKTSHASSRNAQTPPAWRRFVPYALIGFTLALGALAVYIETETMRAEARKRASADYMLMPLVTRLQSYHARCQVLVESLAHHATIEGDAVPPELLRVLPKLTRQREEMDQVLQLFTRAYRVHTGVWPDDAVHGEQLYMIQTLSEKLDLDIQTLVRLSGEGRLAEAHAMQDVTQREISEIGLHLEAILSAEHLAAMRSFKLVQRHARIAFLLTILTCGFAGVGLIGMVRPQPPDVDCAPPRRTAINSNIRREPVRSPVVQTKQVATAPTPRPEAVATAPPPKAQPTAAPIAPKPQAEPAAPPLAAAPTPPTPASSDNPAMPTKSRILLAESDHDLRGLVSRTMQEAGADVITALDGRDALQRYIRAVDENTPFDLLLIDMSMKAVTEDTAISMLRNAGYTRPIIGLTNVIPPKEPEYYGCNGFLVRPITPQDVLQVMSEHLGRALQTSAAD